MASTFSTRLRFELIGSGEQDGTWGDTANVNLGTLVEEAIAGVASVTHDDTATYSLTSSNGVTDEARQMILVVGGSLSQVRILECPAQEKLYVVHNNTAGGFALTFQPAGGTGVSVPNGTTTVVYCDGTDIVSGVSHLADLTLSSALTVGSGGTGAATLTDGGVLLGSGTGAVTALAQMGDGEVLVGTGAGDPVAESGATLRTSLGLALDTDVDAFTATIGQAEAEAGTATTRRTFTAQRVAQAIAALGQAFPSGTIMLFNQTSAPTGWTKLSVDNDKALRLTTGTVGTGGATAFTSVLGSGKTTGGYTLLEADIPDHTHLILKTGDGNSTGISSSAHTGAVTETAGPFGGANYVITQITGPADAGVTSGTGGDGSHSHTLSLDLQYVDVILASKD